MSTILTYSTQVKFAFSLELQINIKHDVCVTVHHFSTTM